MTTLLHRYLVAADDEERVVAELWERRTLGVEVVAAGVGELELRAYFAGGEEIARDGWEIPGARLLAREAVPETDWLAPYRESARPFAVGRRFLLDPREASCLDTPSSPRSPSHPPRILLRVPARAAFGTGSHESTRLVLELLEEIDLAGARVLDIGTGTGILSLAALALGAAAALAFDVDPAAPLHARANRRLNRAVIRGERRFALFAGTLAALRPPAAGAGGRRFDLALVNVIPEEIAPDLPALRPWLVPGGEAIFSGILAASGARVRADLALRGFATFAERQAGEWVALRARVAV